MEETLGNVEAGQIADLVAVLEDLLDRIKLLRQNAFVTKDDVV